MSSNRQLSSCSNGATLVEEPSNPIVAATALLDQKNLVRLVSPAFVFQPNSNQKQFSFTTNGSGTNENPFRRTTTMSNDPPGIRLSDKSRGKRDHNNSEEKVDRSVAAETFPPDSRLSADGTPSEIDCDCCFETIIPTVGRELTYHYCRGRKHVICNECIRLYVEHWNATDRTTLYQLKQCLDGTNALPCPALTNHAGARHDMHYLPNAVIIKVVSPPTWTRFQEKMAVLLDATPLTPSSSMGSKSDIAALLSMTASASSSITKQQERKKIPYHPPAPPPPERFLQKATAATCQCCFEGMDGTRGVSRKQCCGGGHFLCTDCIRRYVEEWVFAGSVYQLVVVDDGGNGDLLLALPCPAPTPIATARAKNGGSGVFRPCRHSKHQKQRQHHHLLHYLAPHVIQQSVSDVLYRQYCEKTDQIASLSSPDCSSMRITEVATGANSTNQENRKPAAKKPVGADISKKKKKKKQTGVNAEDQLIEQRVHQAAEALTEAIVHRCPKCFTQFVKEDDDGDCNKIRCSTCQANLCYICRKQLTDDDSYDHFCNHDSRCPPQLAAATATTDRIMIRPCRICGDPPKCPLWSSKKAMKASDEARRRAVATDVANRVGEELLLLSSSSSSRAAAAATTTATTSQSHNCGAVATVGDREAMAMEVQRQIDRLL